MNVTKGALAAAAASLFLAAGAAPVHAADTSAGKVKCEGVNSCKGTSACKSLLHSCAGQNSCKGQGFLMLTPEECQKAKAEMGQTSGGTSYQK
jgi:uncharacterized membrane protein